VFFNVLNPGPNAAPPYQQPNTSAPTVNANVANFPTGHNVLGVAQVDAFWQPGGVSFGHFDPNRAPITCPLDGAQTRLVGTHDFPYLCSQCGHQFRSDGTMLQPAVFFPTALVVPSNPAVAGSQWPTEQLPPTDLSNASD
jgi:hypothetical protein